MQRQLPFFEQVRAPRQNQNKLVFVPRFFQNETGIRISFDDSQIHLIGKNPLFDLFGTSGLDREPNTREVLRFLNSATASGTRAVALGTLLHPAESCPRRIPFSSLIPPWRSETISVNFFTCFQNRCALACRVNLPPQPLEQFQL